MSTVTLQQPAKPGTACLGCRNRKVRCTREEGGCSNCLKAGLPCVYPPPESGVKRKRGPYRKDKPPRERHLEDLVKSLEPKNVNVPQTDHPASSDGDRDSAKGSNYESVDSDILSSLASFRRHDVRKTSDLEALVKDALISLTQTSISDREATNEQISTFADSDEADSSAGGALPGSHPPPRLIFEYWHIYLSRVDPLLKIFHAPTFMKRLLQIVDRVHEADDPTQTLLFSIYFSALCSCTAREAHEKFGESRCVLLRRYSRSMEMALNNYLMPELESLQALILYMSSLRREDNLTSVRTLFTLAATISHLLGINEDLEGSYSPFETEMRRRAWWHLCGLESRGAEEGASRHTTIMDGRHVRLPLNLNDNDLFPVLREFPRQRVGVTEMSFVLLRFEIIRLSFELWNIRRKSVDDPSFDVHAEQIRAFREVRRKVEEQYIRHLHASRIYDWMCYGYFEAMSIKSRLIIDYPSAKLRSNNLTSEERLDLLQASVEVIRWTHDCNEERMGDWRWFFRGWKQWHSLAVVISELGQSKNTTFADTAWRVLDPILVGWDQLYRAKKGEPAWEHVHTLIERARQMRQQVAVEISRSQIPSNTLLNQASGSSEHPQSFNNNSTNWHTRSEPRASASVAASGLDADDALMMPAAFDPSVEMFLQIPAPSIEAGGEANTWDGPGDIDFAAFDAVFGDNGWDIPDADSGHYGSEDFSSAQ